MSLTVDSWTNYYEKDKIFRNFFSGMWTMCYSPKVLLRISYTWLQRKACCQVILPFRDLFFGHFRQMTCMDTWRKALKKILWSMKSSPILPKRLYTNHEHSVHVPESSERLTDRLEKGRTKRNIISHRRPWKHPFSRWRRRKPWWSGAQGSHDENPENWREITQFRE